MAAVLRVGIVGASTTGGSGWGALAHIPALKNLPEVKLQAVCASTPETAAAAAQEFGAGLAFHDIAEMARHPDVDAVAVVVRVPRHRAAVEKVLAAGKPVYCEWPLDTEAASAAQLDALARSKGVPAVVGLQARADPTLLHVRDLVADGFVGEVLTASLTFYDRARTQSVEARTWMADRRLGANTLTIGTGHSLDALAMCLGDFTEVGASISTRIPTWRTTDTGVDIKVDSPDTILLSGRLASGARVSVHVAAVPSGSRGLRFEIFGTAGHLAITSPASIQKARLTLTGARGDEAPAAIAVPASYDLLPDAVPPGEPRNVAALYRRLAAACAGGTAAAPDFAHAVRLHRLIETMEQSSREGRVLPVAA